MNGIGDNKKKQQQDYFAAFKAKAPAPQQPELTAEQVSELDLKYEQHKVAQEADKQARSLLLSTVAAKWKLIHNRKGVFGRKSRQQLFDDALLTHVAALINAGSTAMEFDVPKPLLSDTWKLGDPILLDAPAAPASDDPAPPVVAQSSPKPKRKTLHLSDEVKYTFWDLHRDKHHQTVAETLAYVNEHLPSLFGGSLTKTTVLGDKNRKGWKEFKTRPPQQEDKQEKKKSGSNKRAKPTGEFDPWNNKRVSFSVLIVLAGMIMSLVNSGVPITAGTALTLALGLFAANDITWQPKKGWARTFLLRIGLTLRRGTRPARHLPKDYDTVKHLFILRVVYTVLTYSVMPMFFFNLDETGMRFFPIKDRTWAALGADQVDISGLGDKRQFTGIPVVDSLGWLVYMQLVWQGKTDASCPNSTVQKAHPFLTHTRSASHWSTPTTMELLVDDLWRKHVKPKMEAMSLNSATTYWVLLWDVYSSHRDAALLASLKRKYPYLIILFVPASCTSALQPLDVGFNSDFKAIITALACAWLSAFITGLLKTGTSADDIVLPTKKTELVAPFCAWVAGACEQMTLPPSALPRRVRGRRLAFLWPSPPATHVPRYLQRLLSCKARGSCLRRTPSAGPRPVSCLGL